jgi:hypothetical protein
LSLERRYVRLILGALFIFLFVLSLTVYVLSRPWTPRVLFFPEDVTGKLVGERRFLPPRRGLAANVELYVQELILGPSEPLTDRLVPKEVRLDSVVAGQGNVYVSLSREILKPSPDTPLGFDQTLQAIADGVLYNFPQVRRLHLLVEGQVPGERHPDGFSFDKKLLK